jgi:hypothetical protein
MNTLFWLVVFALLCVLGGTAWYLRQRLAQRRRAEEARLAAFVSQVLPAAPAVTAIAAAAPGAGAGELTMQKRLFEAARKTAEAGEPALAIQLYERLLARYPASGLADPSRVAITELRRAVAKA